MIKNPKTLSDERDEKMKITVNNWGKYNSKTELIRHPSWLRISKNIATSRSLFKLTIEERWAFLCLLSECCQHKSSTIDIDIEFFGHVFGINQGIILGAIKKLNSDMTITVSSIELEKELTKCIPGNINNLKELKASVHVEIESTVNAVTENCHASGYILRTDGRTDGQTTLLENKFRASEYFEGIYAGYPRKRGKSAGFKKLVTEIRSLADVDLMIEAVENFTAAMIAEKRPVDKIPYFSSFITGWRDWTTEELAKHPQKPLNNPQRPQLPSRALPAPQPDNLQSDKTPPTPEQRNRVAEMLRMAGLKSLPTN